MILTEQYNSDKKTLFRLQNEICCLNTNFCSKVNTCLSISPNADAGKFLNQQGQWITGGTLQTITNAGSTTTNLITIQSPNAELDVIGDDGNALSFIAGGGAVQITMVNSNAAKIVLSLNPSDASSSTKIYIPTQSPAHNYLVTQVNGQHADVTGNINLTPNGATGSEPSSPHLGQFYFDTTLVKMKFWNGTTWAIITSTP
jgi:hypothetical protein